VAQFLPFVVIGLSVGSIYGLAATGLVLTYKTSGIFNFAYGALASVSVFVFYELHDVQGWPWPLAGALCVFVVGPVMGYLLELLSRQLAAADRTLQIGAMVGLIVWIVFIFGILFSDTSGIFPASPCPLARSSPFPPSGCLAYGGAVAVAVSDVSLAVQAGMITGLVGPNDAGKTSIFSACSGLVRPAAGTIILHGSDITRATPSQRARLGLGRTFQRVQLFESLDVRSNVRLARESALAGGNPLRQVAGRPDDGREIDQAVRSCAGPWPSAESGSCSSMWPMLDLGHPGSPDR
jgi:hypothetical protein